MRDRYPNESLAVARHRRLRLVGDFDFVPDDFSDVAGEILRRAAHGPVWADPSPTDYGTAPDPDRPVRGFCRGCDRPIDSANTAGCRPCYNRARYHRRRAAETQPAEPVDEQLTHRCTTCGAAVTTAQAHLPRCPSCGAGAP